MKLLSVLFCVLPLVVAAQPCRVIGGMDAERANVMVQAFEPADGYVLAGWTRSFGPGTPGATNALVVRTLNDGTPVNAVTSVGAHDEDARSMARTMDGGYVVTGATRSYNLSGTNSDIFVLKLDAQLVPVWGWVYHLPPADFDHEANSIIALMDGTLALTGWYDPTGTGARHVLVARLDPGGLPLWCRTYNYRGDLNDIGYSITELMDHNVPAVAFAVAGSVAPAPGAPTDAFVLRLRADGSVFNAELLPGEQDEEARSIIWSPGPDSLALVVAGWTRSQGAGAPGYANVWVARLRDDAGVLWSNCYYWLPGDIEHDERVLGDKALVMTSGPLGDGYAVCGYTRSRGPGTPDYPNFLLLKVNLDGSVGWGGNATVHPSTPDNNLSDEANSLITTWLPDGTPGYALAGWSNSFATPLLSDNFLFSTFDSAGQRPVGCALQFPMVAEPQAWLPVEFEAVPRRLYPAEFPVILCEPQSVPVCQGDPTGIDQGERRSGDRGLRLSISPNPGRFPVQVSFSLPGSARVAVRLYDGAGRLVATLAEGFLAAGSTSLKLHPSVLAQGIYLVRLEAGSATASAKLIVR